jgi:hypothetical protein
LLYKSLKHKKMLELNLDEAIILIKKLEYTYKKNGSPLIDKIKEFIEEKEKEKK